MHNSIRRLVCSSWFSLGQEHAVAAFAFVAGISFSNGHTDDPQTKPAIKF